MAKIKEQIMLNGGVITSMAMSAGTFANFAANKTAANAMFAVAEDLRQQWWQCMQCSVMVGGTTRAM
jgi:hypothetical protein